MHIKFTKHGRGSSVKAVKYLMQEFDSNENIREVVQIMDGTPELFASMCDSLNFSHRYSSAVIAWHPDDCPSPQQMQEVLDDFKRLSLGGVSAPFLAVRHDNHIHVLIGRVDLETGKAFNPAPKRWQKDFDPLRDYYNAKYDWARPDDPARAKVFTFSRGEGGSEAKDRERLKLDITNHLEFLIIENQIKGRDDIIAELSKIGEVTRETKNSITIQIPEFTKPLRLTGAYYERSFDGSTVEVTREEGRSRADNQQRVRELQELFESRVRKRVEYNETRFGRAEPEHQAELQYMDISTHRDSDLHLSDNLGSVLGVHELSGRSDNNQAGENSRIGEIDTGKAGEFRRVEPFRDSVSKEKRPEFANGGQGNDDRKNLKRDQWENSLHSEKGKLNEPTNAPRSPIIALVERIGKVAREAKRITLATVNAFANHLGARAETTRNLNRAGSELDRAGTGIAAELERINALIVERERINALLIAQQAERERQATRSYDMDM